MGARPRRQRWRRRSHPIAFNSSPIAGAGRRAEAVQQPQGASRGGPRRSIWPFAGHTSPLRRACGVPGGVHPLVRHHHGLGTQAQRARASNPWAARPLITRPSGPTSCVSSYSRCPPAASEPPPISRAPTPPGASDHFLTSCSSESESKCVHHAPALPPLVLRRARAARAQRRGPAHARNTAQQTVDHRGARAQQRRATQTRPAPSRPLHRTHPPRSRGDSCVQVRQAGTFAVAVACHQDVRSSWYLDSKSSTERVCAHVRSFTGRIQVRQANKTVVGFVNNTDTGLYVHLCLPEFDVVMDSTLHTLA